jgi:hypothetical protein
VGKSKNQIPKHFHKNSIFGAILLISTYFKPIVMKKVGAQVLLRMWTRGTELGIQK